jgi:UDP-N-acetylglucosamine acyltransferase
MHKVSPQAIVEKGAQVADDVAIGPFSYIGPHVSLEAGCVIECNVTIVGHTVLGRNNHVSPMCVIGATGEDATRPAAEAGCVLGDANAIREHVAIRGGIERPTRIGRDNLIMVDCNLGAGATVGDHCIFANCTHVGDGGRVEDYVRTSAFTTVEPGATVGAYTFIAGFAGIDRDAPPFAIVQGFPFRVRGVNTQNLKRCGFGEEDITALKQAFHEIYSADNGGADEQILRRLAGADRLNPHVRRLLEALRARNGEAV